MSYIHLNFLPGIETYSVSNFSGLLQKSIFGYRAAFKRSYARSLCICGRDIYILRRSMEPTEEPTKETPRPVTTIVKDLNPVLEDYFNKVLRFIPMFVRQVHKSSGHRPLVFETQAFPFMGMFYILLIRKEISNLMGKEAMDYRAPEKLEDLIDYYNSSSDTESEPENEKEKCPADAEKLPKPVLSDADVDKKEVGPVDAQKNLIKSVPSNADDESEDDGEKEECPVDREQVQKFVISYQKYEDPKNATIDILEDIFNVVSLHEMFFGGSMRPFDPEYLNMNNIKTVLKHAATFDRSHILINPIVACKYFCADANFILDDILLQINTSIHHFEVKRDKCRRHMYQLLLYALGVFVEEGKEIRKFKVYNPLLGYEYFYEIAHLDFNEFLKLVQEIEPL